jgi:2-dehydro-3-deoxyphosphogluconate aldolase/(4S)-4-hydroxy-2-oxoglutarate aldolase
MEIFSHSFSPVSRIVPVAVIPRIEHALPLAEALLEAGLKQIEVTLRTPCALEAMRKIHAAYPEMVIGAGTLLDAGKIPLLKDAGVRFAVSPGLNPEVVEACQTAGLPIVPGVITPGEVERGLSMGLRLLKFFPAEAAGGAKMLAALAGPYGHTGVQFIPTGGIHAGNAADYLNLKVTAAIGGSWFVDKRLLESGDYARITTLTREALALATEA